MGTTYQLFKDFAGPVAAIVASGTAVFVTYRLGKEQSRLAREKLRLDLYDRRWKIFRSIFDFYYVMISWTGTDEQKTVRDQFFMAYQESAFLFDPADGIQNLLKDLNDKGRKVMSYKDDSLQGWDAESKIALHKEVAAIQIFSFEEGLANLTAAMSKYIGFSAIQNDP